MEIQITGVDAIIRKLEAFQRMLPEIMTEATFEAIEYVKLRAQENLQTYFDEPRKPFEPDQTGSLMYDHWHEEVSAIGTSMVGKLSNDHIAAWFIEGGTEDHEIEASEAPQLVFVDPDTGILRHEDSVYVSGIPAQHYLENAVAYNRPAIMAIYGRHLMMGIRRIAA